ncbi:MMPL family transporter [Cohnella abietis]|uniref:SSD domain-containing protein n=1 Tax=Cohnella abietis TaxID=2507935 RepID=A0A3T1D229_9BACL|nr:MMPL family transporter [Cohnella abietis]BBI32167.1 hypothetical protein KCTCHS21_15660 [Cohnella abietis]
MDRWIARLSKLRWAILACWIAVAALSFFALPDLQSIVRKTEQKFLPANAESVKATHLLQNIHSSAQSLTEAIILLTRNEGLLESDKVWMSDLLEQLDSRKAELNITSVLSTQTHPELAQRLLSKDGSSLLAIINLPKPDFNDETKITLNLMQQMLDSAPSGTFATLTGNAPLSQAFQQSSESGLHRTEILTIGLVLIILLFVFRSPITPIIPLLTIGISLIISRALIGLATHFGMPVSHFTESFLIAVLFGAGTDYCILMIQRYREELLSGGDANPVAAISRMMYGVGKTIISSASTILVAFLLIGFAEFGLYQSAVGVAIGIIVTVTVAMTLVPVLLLLFGKSISWSINLKKSPTNRESRLWSFFASLAAKRSVIVLFTAVIFLSPLTLLFDGKRTFDDISEINPDIDAVIGLRQVEKAYSSGEVFPATMVITSTSSMRTTSGLAALEQASSDLTTIDGVESVRSAVRPLGHKPESLTVSGQLNKLNVDSIIKSVMKDQQALVEGLQELALGAVPLSQGLLGVLPAISKMQKGLVRLIESQLGGLKRATPPPAKTEEQLAAQRAAAKSHEQALNYYISQDGLTTKIELILSANPYSKNALDTIPAITQKLRESLSSTALVNPEIFVTGISAKYNELRSISYRDFLRTGILMLVGITLVLMLLLRSIIAPLYVMLSLGFNYLITMGIMELLFVKVLGLEGLSWTVSFFIFLITVALGVDYSIFLMARFKEEYQAGGASLAMNRAMKSTGGVIGSAAIIMAASFGALSLSGINTLVQIGVGAFIGLLLYATLFMTLIVPAFAFLLGENNWWPSKKMFSKKTASEQKLSKPINRD